MHAIDELDALDHVEDGELVLIWLVICMADIDLLRHGSSLVLDEVEGVHHAFDSLPSVYTDRQHSNSAAGQAIVEAECGARAALHIEGDRLETAHMEEGLVLDLGQSRVMQHIAEHEFARLICMPFDLGNTSDGIFLLGALVSVGLLNIFVIGILLVVDGILAGLLIELALHKDVKEVTDSCPVSQFAIDIDGPEEGVRAPIIGVREAYEIDCDMPDNVLVVESTANGLANLRQVDRRQTLLGREATSIDHFAASKFIEGAEESDVTIRLNYERHRGELELVELAQRRSALNHATLSAEVGDILLPAISVERWLRQPDFLRKHLCEGVP